MSTLIRNVHDFEVTGIEADSTESRFGVKFWSPGKPERVVATFVGVEQIAVLNWGSQNIVFTLKVFDSLADDDAFVRARELLDFEFPGTEFGERKIFYFEPTMGAEIVVLARDILWN